MRLLDLCCGAGGASEGYHRAGFEVVGVDIEPQPRYPFPFVQIDALDLLINMIAGDCYRANDGRLYGKSDFVAIHASWPCQGWSQMTKRWKGRSAYYPDLVTPGRKWLQRSGLPWMMENVRGAPLLNPIMLCGTMFGLQTSFGSQLRRHRYFECTFETGLITPCHHNNGSAIGVYRGGQHPNRRVPATCGVYGQSGPGAYSTRDNYCGFSVAERREAMGIDWMTGKELSQAIPPAYTEWIGRRLAEELMSPKEQNQG